MKLLDSTLLVDLLRGKKDAINLINSRETFVTTQINMYEVIKGMFFKNISSSKFNEMMEMFNNIKVLPLDDNSIIKSAEIFSDCKKKGQELPNIDCLIAGIALGHEVSTIITKNVEHFKRIKGIKIESY